MRHRRTYRHFGRSMEHRRAMFRNLATNLLTHERIVTTTHKAKEMRPWIEKLIIKAKKNDHNSHRYVKSILFTNTAMRRLMKDIAPRYEESGLNGGFTRILSVGRRKNDRAKMSMIELVGNPIELWEKTEDQQYAEKLGRPTFWEWELKVLKQEQQYFKNYLDNVQGQIDAEIEEKGANDDQAKDIQAKYSKKMEFLLSGLKRAIVEEEIHLKQKDHKMYRLFDVKYGQNDAWDMRTMLQNQNEALNN